MMRTEREYRISCIKERFPALEGRKVVIYGTGINAKLIIDHANDIIDIVGLMDESQTGLKLYGYKVLSREEVILCADTIVIAAQINSAIAVYNRIQDFCGEYNFDVFDLYGNEISNLLHSIIVINNENDERTKCTLFCNKTVSNAVKSADVISIDLKAIFGSIQMETVLFQEVWKSKFHKGTKAFVELRTEIGNQQEKSYGSLNSVYNTLKTILCLSEEDADTLLKTELDLRKQHIKMDDNIMGLIKLIQDNDKKLFLINETLFPGGFWKDVLKNKGIMSEHVSLLNRSESGHNKYNGLYREILEFEPNQRYLHIGNDYDADGIAASVYGFQSIVIERLHQNVEKSEETRDSDNLPTNHIREYCTDRIEYSPASSWFDGYIKLNIRDQYYIIISKDADVKPGWLEQLVSTVENHKEACIVCSRVSRENGTVIYAGEIVSEDYAAQQIQMVSGFLPIFDYMRYTGQICVVSFLVRKSWWDEVENTAPELQKVLRNYIELTKKSRVIYQPLSEVSYRQTDIDCSTLVTDIDVPRQQKILVTDNLLTQFDHDAGSRCTWFYLNQFHKLGYEVTLMAQNFNEIQPYVMLLQQAGIRVIYGDYYRSHWKKWLSEENDSFQYVYMQRPGSTSYFIDEIKEKCKSAKLFYFAHDLHFLRLQREYEITGNQNDLKASEKSKEQECALIEDVEVVHVVGSFEQEYLQRMYPDKKIRNIPLYIYEQKPENQISNYDVTNRKDLLYVGSFGHPPNLDAVIWFAEHILPHIVEKHPDIVWHVVGANPPVEVQKYQGKNLVLHGFLSDDDLRKLYNTCRIVVVPLRYGAGVKGKIVEASYYQVPIVTTPIGAEGIPQEEKNMVVCNTEQEFADAVCELYSDEDRLCKMSEGGRKLTEKYYSEEAVNRVLRMDMPELLK